jgi:hypothetical protein
MVSIGLGRIEGELDGKDKNSVSTASNSIELELVWRS